ncbi:MAG: DUF2161 family putative PD-(D/E)XK-type phosphodiesterase [Roseovarius sp.]
MPKPAETALYAPVKAYFEALGYTVKGEVGAADLMALKPGEEPLICELKTTFSLTLLQQAIARQAVTDEVYVAVPRWSGKAGWRAFKGNIGLCKRLGLGVLSVTLTDGTVQAHAAPAPFQPRKSKVKREALMKEFTARAGDPTMGGTNGKITTSYRQDALRCAAYLAQNGIVKGAEVATQTGVARATRIMADNHHGWFCRAARGLYALSEAGEAALLTEMAPPSKLGENL